MTLLVTAYRQHQGLLLKPRTKSRNLSLLLSARGQRLAVRDSILHNLVSLPDVSKAKIATTAARAPRKQVKGRALSASLHFAELQR